ncbi:MAG: transcriptional regulator [bacterium]|jgi:transcriptional regulator with XRE-family HTH domain
MDLIRIGDKVIDRERVHQLVERIFQLRSAGVSQQEVATILGTERTFVSRLESLGEIRKGGSIALLGFPVLNKAEIEAVAKSEGVEFIFLLTEEERWRYVKEKNGLDLLNEIMDLIAKLRVYNSVIFLGSNMRVQLVEALLGRDVVGIELGISPLAEDVYVDPEKIRQLIKSLS